MENPVIYARRQIRQIKDGGSAILMAKMLDLASLLMFAFIPMQAVMTVALIRLIRPVVLIRLGRVPSPRIGHFAGNIELYLCEKDIGLGDRKAFDIFFYANGRICNYQLDRMWRRNIRIWRLAKPLYLINKWIPGGERHVVKLPTDRDIHNILYITKPHLSFTKAEERRALKGLAKLGIPEGAEFACFHARDSAYLNSMNPSLDWGYHRFRDSDINNYLPAVSRLTERGYYAVRMGAMVTKRIETKNPRIIDYAAVKRTGFMDIYLASRCRFFITSGTGIDAVAVAFRRPIACVNYLPLNFICSWRIDGIFITKKLWSRKEKRFMTFAEMAGPVLGGLCDIKEYDRLGIDIVENTPEEITELVIEMDERIKGRWKTTEEDEALQRRLGSLFTHGRLHGRVMTHMGTKFLRNNRELLR